MLKYIIRRLLRFGPILFCITFIGFLLSNGMPGDPVDKILIARHGVSYNNTILNSSALRDQLYREMGLHLPLFYFSFNAYSQCDTLNRISNKARRMAAERMTHNYGCWPQIQSYHQEIKMAIDQDDPEINNLKTLLEIPTYKESAEVIDRISQNSPNTGERLKAKLDQILEHKSTFGNFIPTINFHGAGNQYHVWLFGNGKERAGLVRGDFGYSLKTGQPIGDFIWKKLGFSLELILISVVVAFVTAIPLGLRLSRIRSTKRKNILTLPIYLLYSIPGYLIATLLIFFFANTNVVHWFPESGLYPIGYRPADHSYINNLITGLPYMILPISTYALSSFAFVAKLTANISAEELNYNYVRTALSKGLSIKQVVRKHVFKNTWIPLITIFTQILPAAVGGTLIVELIFNYPGIGKTVYDAVLNNNYPVIVAIFTISGLLTLSSYLFADVLYAFADPKIKMQR